MFNKLILICGILANSICLAIPYPENQGPMSYNLNLSFFEVEQADHTYEKRLATSLGTTFKINDSFAHSYQLLLAPDLSKDTSELSVYQDFYSVSGVLEYSYIYLFRFFTNAGPQFTHQRIQYNFRGNRESFTDNTIAWTFNLGLEYAMTQSLRFQYSTGWNWRFRDERLDKSQHLGVNFDI